MVDTIGPFPGPSSHAEGENPNRLATRAEEQAFKDSLVTLRDNLIHQRPDVAEAGSLQAVDQDGALIEFDFETDNEFMPNESIHAVSLWYEGVKMAVPERSNVFQ